jgi:hypothetical protein
MIEILAMVKCDGPRPFTAGIVLQDDVVVEAAPIVGLFKRQKFTRERVREYCRQKGWKVSIVHELKRSATCE